jgi:hypothetical protein
MADALQNLVAYGECHRSMAPILMALVDGLSLQQTVTDVPNSSSCSSIVLATAAARAHQLHRSGWRKSHGDGGRVMVIDHPQWYVAERRLIRRVVDVRCPWEPAKPLARPVTCEATQVHGDHFVSCLRLAICQGVERRGCEAWRRQRLSSRQNMEVNTRLRLEMRDIGMPCRWMILVKKTLATVSAMYGCTMGMKWQY